MNEKTQVETTDCFNATVEYFGSKTKMASALQTSTQNIQNWGVRGKIPASNALKVERMTNGVIKARDILIENEAK